MIDEVILGIYLAGGNTRRIRKALEPLLGQAHLSKSAVSLVNLEEHCPVHARPEMKRDYHAIVNAVDGLAARKEFDTFVSKWSVLGPPVARSLEEAGTELLTFYD